MNKLININVCSVKLYINEVTSSNILHILTDDDLKRSDLPLPRLGRKRISSELGKVSFIDDGNIAHIIVGAGSFDETKHLTTEQWHLAIGAHIFETLKAEKIEAINFESNTALNFNIAYGLGIRSFTDGVKTTPIQLGNVNTEALKGLKQAECTNFTRRLINIPHGFQKKDGSNIGLNSQSFAKLLCEEFSNHAAYTSRKALNKLGAGGLYSVGLASSNEPALIEASYKHPKCTDAPVVISAKGVMYDTGGAAIKSVGGMVTMKYDMSAAATFAGVLKYLKDTEAFCNVTVIFGLADNAVGPTMTYNGDYVEMMDGKIMEMSNTDAEGRVVLYDGLVYGQTKIDNAKIFMSMGTLTGTGKAVIGSRKAMYFCRNETLNAKLVETATQCGQIDEIFRLPVDLRVADVALSKKPEVDLINSIRESNTSMSEAAYYVLRQSMQGENEQKYIHFDIGGGIVGNKQDITGLTLPDFSGTGWGVYTLGKFITNLYK